MNILRFEVNIFILGSIFYLASSASIKTKRPETNDKGTSSTTWSQVKTAHQSNTQSSQNVPVSSDEIVYGLLPADSPHSSTAQFGSRFKSTSTTSDSSTSVKTFQENSKQETEVQHHTQQNSQSTPTQKRVSDSILSNSHHQVSQSSFGSKKSAISSNNPADPIQENSPSLNEKAFISPTSDRLPSIDNFGVALDIQDDKTPNQYAYFSNSNIGGDSPSHFEQNADQVNDDFYEQFEDLVGQSAPGGADANQQDINAYQVFSQNFPQQSQFANDDPLGFTNQENFNYEYASGQTAFEDNSQFQKALDEDFPNDFADNPEQQEISNVDNESVNQAVDTFQQVFSFNDQSQQAIPIKDVYQPSDLSERTDRWSQTPSQPSTDQTFSVKSEGSSDFSSDDQSVFIGSGDPIEGLKEVVPGTPGEDYPIFYQVPFTSFSCDQQPYSAGIYGDMDASCQVFHFCEENGAKHSFLCPNGTVFNQQYFVCDWWYNYNCAETPSFYNLNAELYANLDDINPSQILSGQGITDEKLFSVDQLSSQSFDLSGRVESSQTSGQSTSISNFNSEIQKHSGSSFGDSSQTFGVSSFNSRDENEYQNENFDAYDVRQIGQPIPNFETGSFSDVSQSHANTAAPNFEGQLLTERKDESFSFSNENYNQRADQEVLVDPIDFPTEVLEITDIDSTNTDTNIGADTSSLPKSAATVDSDQTYYGQEVSDGQVQDAFQDQIDFDQGVAFEENNSGLTQNVQNNSDDTDEVEIPQEEQRTIQQQNTDFNNGQIFQQALINDRVETNQIGSLDVNVGQRVADSLPNASVHQTQNENSLVNTEITNNKQSNTNSIQNSEKSFSQQKLTDVPAITPNFAKEELLGEFNNRATLFSDSQKNSEPSNSFTTAQEQQEKVIFPETPKISDNENSQFVTSNNSHKNSNLNEVLQVKVNHDTVNTFTQQSALKPTGIQDNQQIFQAQLGQQQFEEFKSNQQNRQQNGIQLQSNQENFQPVQEKQPHTINSIQSNQPTNEQGSGKQLSQQQEILIQRVQQQNIPIQFEQGKQSENTFREPNLQFHNNQQFEPQQHNLENNHQSQIQSQQQFQLQNEQSQRDVPQQFLNQQSFPPFNIQQSHQEQEQHLFAKQPELIQYHQQNQQLHHQQMRQQQNHQQQFQPVRQHQNQEQQFQQTRPQQNQQQQYQQKRMQQFNNQQQFQLGGSQQNPQQEHQQTRQQLNNQQQFNQRGQQQNPHQQYQQTRQQQNHQQFQQGRQQQQYQQTRHQQQYPLGGHQQNTQNQHQYNNNVPQQNSRFRPLAQNIEQQREFIQFPNVVQQQNIIEFDRNSNIQTNDQQAQINDDLKSIGEKPATIISGSRMQVQNQDKSSLRPTLNNGQQVIILNETPSLKEIAQVVEDELTVPQQGSENAQNEARQPRLNNLRPNMQMIGPEDTVLYNQNSQIPTTSSSSYNGWRPILKKY